MYTGVCIVGGRSVCCRGFYMIVGVVDVLAQWSVHKHTHIHTQEGFSWGWSAAKQHEGDNHASLCAVLPHRC